MSLLFQTVSMVMPGSLRQTQGPGGVEAENQFLFPRHPSGKAVPSADREEGLGKSRVPPERIDEGSRIWSHKLMLKSTCQIMEVDFGMQSQEDPSSWL